MKEQQIYLIQDEGYNPVAAFKSLREIDIQYRKRTWFKQFEDQDGSVLSRLDMEQTLKHGERVYAIMMLPGEKGGRVEEAIIPMPANVLDSSVWTNLRLPYETDRMYHHGGDLINHQPTQQ